MSDATTALAAIVTSIIGLAIVAVIFSQRSQTSQVLQAGGSALGTLITAAVSPVTQGGGNPLGIGG
jgi:hypothetical protein